MRSLGFLPIMEGVADMEVRVLFSGKVGKRGNILGQNAPLFLAGQIYALPPACRHTAGQTPSHLKTSLKRIASKLAWFIFCGISIEFYCVLIAKNFLL